MSNVNEDQERYLYTVFPKKPIRNLNENVPVLRVSKSLLLTKDEARKCLESASLYRWFANEKTTEKITVYDLDRVHRAVHISKEDWKKMNEADVNTLAVNGVNLIEENTTNEKENISVEIEEPEVKEAVVEEVVDDVVKEEEEVKETETAFDNDVEEVVEEAVETESEDKEVEETPVLIPNTPVNTNYQQRPQLNYNKNNKNNKKH